MRVNLPVVLIGVGMMLVSLALDGLVADKSLSFYFGVVFGIGLLAAYLGVTGR